VNWLNFSPDSSLFTRYWGEEHDYRSMVVDIKRGGIVSPCKSSPKFDTQEKPDEIPDEHLPEFPSPPRGLVKDMYPPEWKGDEVCVVDPFIRTKVRRTHKMYKRVEVNEPMSMPFFQNVTKNVARKSVRRLQRECQAAALLLSLDGEVQ
jgi:hypothetical protein